MADQEREPDERESVPAPEPEVEGSERQKTPPSVSIPPTGRTISNVHREGRMIT